MSVCPWCKSKSSAEVCPSCGKKASSHPSVAGLLVDDDFGGGEGAPGPALELAGPTNKLDASSQLNAAAAGMQSFGDDWGEDAAELPGPALDLAPGVIPERNSRSSPAASPAARSSTSTSSLAAQRPSGSKIEGRSSSGAPDARVSSLIKAAPVDVDPYEVLALADYGVEPKSIFHTVPYAVRVKLRQRELRRALGGVRKALKDAEARRDDRLTELGELLRPAIEGNPEYAAMTAPLADAEKTKQTRQAAVANASSEFRDRAAAIDAQIAAQQPPLDAAKAEVAAKQAAYEQADQLRQRHEARRKRVEIDVRAAMVKLGSPDASSADKGAAQSLIAAAKAERETRATEERIAGNAAQEAEARAAVARRALADVEGKIDALRARRRELEKEFARQGAVRSQGIDAASQEVRFALLEIGRRAVGSAGAATVRAVEGAEVRRKAVEGAEGQVKRLQIDLEKHLRALDAADAKSVRKGLIVLGAVAFVLVLSFVLWRALRRNPWDDYAKDRAQTPSAAPSR